ncbi:hypothetical protein PC119_g17386 [Phytophthora cactorum]|nr:hypothetical protein PC114_g17347 [Phytophthora cactorum]KAG2977784.1 hypothetical protein PC120_g25433 [Phytophthora cactorum]KAG2998808.1 hypothetical protein PC119_g17386 [Phytophthora cactorum]KAG3129828.1 hypothetical protein PC128_g26810 [Phytophthora cactorum]KAG3139775.1 hypothetical protein C6341_g20235 [Phytophthora cactorum]
MRICYAVIATAATLLTHCDVSSLVAEPSPNKLTAVRAITAGEITSTNKGSLTGTLRVTTPRKG